MVGVHLTPRVNGRVLMGPNAALALAKEGYKFWHISLRDALLFATTKGRWKLVFGNPWIVFQEIWQDINKHAFIAEAQRYSLIRKRIKNAVHSFYHNHKMKPGTLLKELSCLNQTECCARGANEAILLACIWLSSECLKYVGVCCSRY